MFTQDQCLLYLQRIHFQIINAHLPPPTLQTLTALHNLHMCHVPFETLIIHVPENCADTSYSFGKGKGVDISAAVLFDKIVTRKRGGFCFELNGCFSHLLRGIGFEVRERTGRVCNVDANFPGSGNEYVWEPLNHEILLVTTEDRPETFMVDVGFSANGLFSPIIFKNGATATGISRFETFTLRNEPLPGYPEMPNGWTLYKSHANEHEGRDRAWIHFMDHPVLQIDLECGTWFAATKAHTFARTYMVTRLDESTKGKVMFLYSEDFPTPQFIRKGEDGAVLEKRIVENLQDAKIIWKDFFGLVLE